MNNESVTKFLQNNTAENFTENNKNINGVIQMKSHFGGDKSQHSFNTNLQYIIHYRNQY